MIDHAPLPDDYYGSEHEEDSPLTHDEIGRFRDELRYLLTGIKEEADVVDLDHPAIRSLNLACLRNEDTLTVTVYLDSDEIEIDPTANVTFDEQGDETVSEDVHYLRDMGDEWWALEWAILTELVMLLDLPESPLYLADYLVGGEEHGPCLMCDTKTPESVGFTVIAYIPDHTQKIYNDAELETARQFRIPIDGSEY